MTQFHDLALLSQRVRRRMDWFHSANFSPREETITEQLVAELFHGSVGQTKVWKSNVSQEMTEGHDFRWAIKGPWGTWAHLHVQAKKLAQARTTSRVPPGYEELGKNARKNKEALQQCRRLIAVASQTGPRSIPIYAFYLGDYSPWDTPHSTPTGRIGKRSRIPLGACAKGSVRREASSFVWSTFLGSPLGVVLTPAVDVENLLQLRRARGSGWKIGPDDLTSNSMPWECLVCTQCNPSGGGGSTHPRPDPDPPPISEIRAALFEAPLSGNEYFSEERQSWVGWVVDNGQWINQQSDSDLQHDVHQPDSEALEVLQGYPASYYLVSELVSVAGAR